MAAVRFKSENAAHGREIATNISISASRRQQRCRSLDFSGQELLPPHRKMLSSGWSPPCRCRRPARCLRAGRKGRGLIHDKVATTTPLALRSAPSDGPTGDCGDTFPPQEYLLIARILQYTPMSLRALPSPLRRGGVASLLTQAATWKNSRPVSATGRVLDNPGLRAVWRHGLRAARLVEWQLLVNVCGSMRRLLSSHPTIQSGGVAGI